MKKKQSKVVNLADFKKAERQREIRKMRDKALQNVIDSANKLDW